MTTDRQLLLILLLILVWAAFSASTGIDSGGSHWADY